MYMPFFRGKQFELETLLASAPGIVNKLGTVVPIIEPVNVGQHTKSKLPVIAKAGVPFVLLTNPQHGKLVGASDVQEMIVDGLLKGHSGYIKGFTITARHTVDDVKTFLKLYRNESVALVHRTEHKDAAKLKETIDMHTHVVRNIFIESRVGTTYRGEFENRVLLRDGFNAAERNADYPEDDSFSDLHSTYKRLKYQGFGDFSIVGDRYKEGGGSGAHTVALHLTYPTDSGAIRTRHFLSASSRTTTETARKFKDANRKLVEHVTRLRSFPKTKGFEMFYADHSRGHFPGLGKAKGYSMIHHLDLMIGIV